MSYEGLRDWFGRECRSLINIRENNWEFAGLNIPGLEGFEVDIGKISGTSKTLQNISDLILALDNIQFSDCQKRKKWHKRLEDEPDPTIRLEITRRILDSEEKSYEHILEIVRLLKGSKSTIENVNESAVLETQLRDLLEE
jgi:hypothetical protein